MVVACTPGASISLVSTLEYRNPIFLRGVAAFPTAESDI